MSSRLRAILMAPLLTLAVVAGFVVAALASAPQMANAASVAPLHHGVSAHKVAPAHKVIAAHKVVVERPLPPPSDSSNFGGTASNTVRMYDFFRYYGYSNNGALGIIGNISVESGGNPEQTGFGSPGDGGLIMWTPMSEYNIAITGNIDQDLYQQLYQILVYNHQNGGGGALFALNTAPSPGAAASIYTQDFEKCDTSDASCSGPERAQAAYDAGNTVAQYYGH